MKRVTWQAKWSDGKPLREKTETVREELPPTTSTWRSFVGLDGALLSMPAEWIINIEEVQS